MIFFLDTNLVIYFIENPPVYGPKATAYLTALRAMGHSFAVTDLVRMECRVLPIRTGNVAILGEYDSFFALADVTTFDVCPPFLSVI